MNTIDWTATPTRDTQNAQHELPPFFLVKAFDEYETRIMMFQSAVVYRHDHTGPANLKFYKFSTVEYPLTYLDKAIYHETGTETAFEQYWIERDKTEARPLSIYKNLIHRTNAFLRTQEFGDLYLYNFNAPILLLPPHYWQISQAENGGMRNWFVRAGEDWCNFRAPPQPQPPPRVKVVQEPKVKAIPTHIFRCFVEAAIAKKEECPITMETLTKESVGAPPCGHLFDKDALKRTLKESGKCPTCRQVANMSNIQTYQ